MTCNDLKCDREPVPVKDCLRQRGSGQRQVVYRFRNFGPFPIRQSVQEGSDTARDTVNMYRLHRRLLTERLHGTPESHGPRIDHRRGSVLVRIPQETPEASRLYPAVSLCQSRPEGRTR